MDGDPPAPLPESLGDYAIEGVLGEGGFGVVYAARHDTLPVALKVLRDELDLTDSERSRFLKEAAALEALDHPSIVSLLDHGVLADGRPFIAMERLAGGPLIEQIEAAPLPREDALRLFAQLADAVAAVHDQDLVHRDIKPENIIVDADASRVVLLDLGIAKGVFDDPSTTTRAGRVRGTPAYMAPERFYGTSASIKTDIYELALVLYMMLLGRLPWDDPTDPALRHHPIPPSNAGVAKALSDVLLRALSVDAKRRPISARALARAVAEASAVELGAQTTAAEPIHPAAAPSRRAVTPDTTPPAASAVVSPPPPPARWRAPLVAALVAGGLVSVPWALRRTEVQAVAEDPPFTIPSSPELYARMPTDASAAVASLPEATAVPQAPTAPHAATAGTTAAPQPVASHGPQPLGPPGPAPPAPWCDRYIALWCSPDARAWSKIGCGTAKSVVHKNGQIYARLPDKAGHDRICKKQYSSSKSFVEEGIADMHARNAKQAAHKKKRSSKPSP